MSRKKRDSEVRNWMLEGERKSKVEDADISLKALPGGRAAAASCPICLFDRGIAVIFSNYASMCCGGCKGINVEVKVKQKQNQRVGRMPC